MIINKLEYALWLSEVYPWNAKHRERATSTKIQPPSSGGGCNLLSKLITQVGTIYYGPFPPFNHLLPSHFLGGKTYWKGHHIAKYISLTVKDHRCGNNEGHCNLELPILENNEAIGIQWNDDTWSSTKSATEAPLSDVETKRLGKDLQLIDPHISDQVNI